MVRGEEEGHLGSGRNFQPSPEKEEKEDHLQTLKERRKIIPGGICKGGQGHLALDCGSGGDGPQSFRC
jgi:hypothetical protein